MPELPEVETIARGLRAHLMGERIVGAEVRHPAVLATPLGEFIEALRDVRIDEIARVGKFLILNLENAAHRLALIIHLGMTGQLTLARPDTPLEKHTHAVFFLEGRSGELRYRDIRRFGRIRLLPAEKVPALFRSLGQDAFEITPQELRERLRGRKAPIKSLLLNQTILRGLGNIYADESLFAAGIHPLRRAGTLSTQELERLRLAIRSVLARAIARRGSSISNYITVDGRAGDFQRYHRVYRKLGQPCTRCATAIARILVAGRSSHFCPQCQPRRRRDEPPARKNQRRTRREDSAFAGALDRAHRRTQGKTHG